MRPGWVQNLDDYWRWVESLIEGSGGFLSSAYLGVELVETELGSGQPLALIVHDHTLWYHDGSYLRFQFGVNVDLELTGYNFHYARGDDSIVWRLDKHRRHEEDDGTDSHIHLPGGQRRPHEVVDLDDILPRIVADQAT